MREIDSSRILIEDRKKIWYTILAEAEKKTQLTLNMPVKHYIIFLLQTHMTDLSIMQSSLPSTGCIPQGNNRFYQIKKNAELCLLKAGLWPNHDEIQIAKQVGKKSFLQLAQACKTKQPNLSYLYQAIATNMEQITRVMHAIQ